MNTSESRMSKGFRKALHTNHEYLQTICLGVEVLRGPKDWNGWKKMGWKHDEDVKKKNMVTVSNFREEAAKHEAQNY